jgi:hypothetical protein
MWPLGAAVLLLIVEGLIPEAPLPRLPSGLLAMPTSSGRIRPERKSKKDPARDGSRRDGSRRDGSKRDAPTMDPSRKKRRPA